MSRRGDGEGEIGQVEHRHAADAQRHVARHAAFAVVIEHQGVRLDMPGGMQAGAGRPGNAFEIVAVVRAVKAGVFRRADRRLLFAAQIVFRFFKRGGLRFAVVMPLDAFNRRFGSGDDAAAFQLRLAFFMAVSELRREQVLVALVHLYRAGKVRATVIARGVVGTHVYFLVVRVAAQFGKHRQRIGDTLQRPRFQRNPQKNTPEITQMQHANHRSC